MIRVGIIGDIQNEEQVYKTLHNSKDIETVGLYSPGKDFKSARFKNYHNPIELLELSDAILVCNTERISTDFIRMMVRRSKHIYFRKQPLLSLTEANDIFKLQKEAGSVIHLFNPLLAAKPEIINHLKQGVKIINIKIKTATEKELSTEIMNALNLLHKLENTSVKHCEVLGLRNSNAKISINIHENCSNGSVHNILFSDEISETEILIFQKEDSVCYTFSGGNNPEEDIYSFNNLAFQNFISCIKNKVGENISFEDYFNSLKTYLEIKEKLNYSGIDI